MTQEPPPYPGDDGGLPSYGSVAAATERRCSSAAATSR